MKSDRDRFLTHQAEITNELARLAPEEEEFIVLFSRLATETFDALIAQGVRNARMVVGFSAWPKSAGFFLRPWNDQDKVSSSIQGQWQQWERDYSEVEARSPRLELRNLMQTMSESLDAMSWPQEQEWQIEQWVASGDFDHRPYYRDKAVYARLRALHTRLGGWLYQDDHGYVHFADLEEFKAIRRARDAVHREAVQREAERSAAALRAIEEREARGGNFGLFQIKRK